MANISITYNGFNNDSVSYIALTDIPNIITVEDLDDNGAQYAALTISCTTTSIANQNDGRFVIELFGESITSVKNYENSINNNFWISSTDNVSTAASIARALRNCQSLVANFIIENYSNVVRLTGRRLFETDFQSNFHITDTEGQYTQQQLWNNFFDFVSSDGQDPSTLTNAKLTVDIYSGSNFNYVTTLEKICPEKSVSFNVSPAITTIAEYGRTNLWSYRVAYTTYLGKYQALNTNEDNLNYVSIGYMVNQGYGRGLHQIESDTAMIAQNVDRGSSNPSFTNHTLLYTYGSTIPLSFYRGNNGGGSIVITYRDSAYQFIGSATTTWHSTDSSNKLKEFDYNLVTSQETSNWFNKAFYIDIDEGSFNIRYNVIKPLKAAEDYTRIYFRNSYGGKSFIDLTGKKTETRDLETKTYQKDIYDYQDTSAPNVLDVIYDNQVKYNVTQKSHLFEGDGRWIYNDLLQSSKVWTYVNGEEYDIIIDSVSVDELDNSNDTWEATVKWHYSMHPSIL